MVKQNPHIEPVIIHDVKESNPWPIAAAVFVMLVLGALIFEHNKTADNVAKLTTTSGPELVVNNHAPLFQTPSSTMPQLAHTTSLKSNPPPPVAKSEIDEPPDEEIDDSTDDPDDLPLVATTAGPQSIQLSDVQLATQDDGQGHEIAVGTATVYNPSQYEVSGFQLYVATGGGTYRLEPFSGSIDNPNVLENTTLLPGGRMTVPVMSNGIITVTDQNASKTVTVEAVENGVAVSSHVIVN